MLYIGWRKLHSASLEIPSSSEDAWYFKDVWLSCMLNRQTLIQLHIPIRCLCLRGITFLYEHMPLWPCFFAGLSIMDFFLVFLCELWPLDSLWAIDSKWEGEPFLCSFLWFQNDTSAFRWSVVAVSQGNATRMRSSEAVKHRSGKAHREHILCIWC